MPLVAVHTRSRALSEGVFEALEPRHDVASSRSWEGLARLVKERPVCAVLVDLPSFAAGRRGEEALAELRLGFPRLGLVLLAGPDDPLALFRLGRAGIPNLVLLSVDRLEVELPKALGRACRHAAFSRVARELSSRVPHRELRAVRIALESVHRRWSAEDFAAAVGLSRPFLSERLKQASLPSAGHLLVWVRLLHAGAWLSEPGRTGESVSRQLDYSSGAAFRRALRTYTGATPTEVIRKGGLDFVLKRFLERNDMTGPRGRPPRLSVA